ncbi:MAG: MFS transporter [Alphaproteobacteria bacterium]|nr:MFS transporter [Alphaproteobacteria bacterium]
MTSLRNVSALIAAVTILQLGQGLLGSHMPLAFVAQGAPRPLFGVVAAAYSAGFMLGAAVATLMLSRVGHIRVFAACAAILSVSILGLHGVSDVWGWSFVRFIAGAVVALMFAAAESWMSGSLSKTERGGIVGVYMVCTKIALALGPFLVFGASVAAPEPWMLAAALASLAMVPVCMTSVAQPAPPKALPLALIEQFQIAPAAVIACFGAGLVNAGVLAYAPLFASDHYGAAHATSFYAAGWFGSLVLQWPAGRVSDLMDRRIVIAALTALSSAAAIALAMFGAQATPWLGMALFALWGAGALSFYGIAVAHMADRAQPGVIAQATSGLLFIWALGSVIGPLAQAPFVHFFGSGGAFWFAGAAAIALTLAMFWRGAQRPAPTSDEKERFSNQPATSVAAGEIAYGEARDTPPGVVEAR